MIDNREKGAPSNSTDWEDIRTKTKDSPVTGENFAILAHAVLEDNKEREKRMDAKMALLEERISKTVPGGDIEAHRQYHEEIMETRKKRAQLYTNLTENTLKTIVIGILMFVVNAVWEYIKK